MQLVRGETTVSEAVERARVDRATVAKLKTVARDGALGSGGGLSSRPSWETARQRTRGRPRRSGTVTDRAGGDGGQVDARWGKRALGLSGWVPKKDRSGHQSFASRPGRRSRQGRLVRPRRVQVFRGVTPAGRTLAWPPRLRDELGQRQAGREPGPRAHTGRGERSRGVGRRDGSSAWGWLEALFGRLCEVRVHMGLPRNAATGCIWRWWSPGCRRVGTHGAGGAERLGSLHRRLA